MIDPQIRLLCTLCLGMSCFACFAWGTLRHFTWKSASGIAGAWAISLASWAGLLVFVWQLLTHRVAETWMLAWLLFGASFGLWLWSVATTRATPPSLMFSDDEPDFLLDAGPYRWVRHPFYTSYLLFWVGTILATATIPVIGAFLVLLAMYIVAARHEEAKFARSTLATRYLRYAARTGRFLPRLRHAHPARVRP